MAIYYYLSSVQIKQWMLCTFVRSNGNGIHVCEEVDAGSISLFSSEHLKKNS